MILGRTLQDKNGGAGIRIYHRGKAKGHEAGVVSAAPEKTTGKDHKPERELVRLTIPRITCGFYKHAFNH